MARLLSVDLKRQSTRSAVSSGRFEPLTRIELSQLRRYDRHAASDEVTEAVAQLVRSLSDDRQRDIEQ